MSKLIINYLLDAVIGLAFILSAVTGIAFLFMGSGGFQGGRNASFSSSLMGITRDTWSDLHTLASLVMITGILIHLVLHWRWIVCATQQFLKQPIRRSDAT